MVANALAAAGLVRAYGIEPKAVRQGIQDYVPGDHRIQPVARHNGVLWINDSKATNPHAASASLAAFSNVIWIAGGLSKGVTYDDLVREHAPRRHAPDVPVIGTAPGETEQVQTAATRGVEAGSPVAGKPVMSRAVASAAQLAGSGDTVLMAPAAASMDQFSSYAHRGDTFIEAVRELVEGQAQTGEE